MVVISIGTSVGTKGVTCSACIIQYFVDQSIFQEGFQGSIDCHPVVFAIDLSLNVSMRNSHIIFHEYANNISPALGEPKGMIL